MVPYGREQVEQHCADCISLRCTMMAAVTAVTVLSVVGLIVAVAAAAAFILRRIAQSALKAACNDQDRGSIQQHPAACKSPQGSMSFVE